MEISRAIDETHFLPSYLSITQRALELLEDEAVEISHLAGVIGTEPALTAKFLRLVNSANFGMRRPVEKIDTALVYLGLIETRNTLLAMSMYSLMHGGLSHDAWANSLLTAYFTEMLARKGSARVDTHRAFLAGLLCHIGAVFLESQYPHEYLEVRLKSPSGLDIRDAEFQVFGYDHAIVGEMLIRKWKLSAEIGEAILYHHCPDETGSPMAWILAYANQIIQAKGDSSGIEELGRARIGLRFEVIQALYDASLLKMVEMEHWLARIAPPEG
jgi:HD-like signal output (HDOD) protein